MVQVSGVWARVAGEGESGKAAIMPCVSFVQVGRGRERGSRKGGWKMSLVGRVESARRATAPIVGIPLEGEEPFAVSRSLLVESLKGLKVIDAGVQLHLETGKPCQLVVYAVGKGVKAVRKFNPCAGILGHSVRLDLWYWAGKEREKRKAPPKVRTTAREKQLTRLRKQLEKMGKPEPPLHPFRPSQYGDTAQQIRERDRKEVEGWERLVAEGCQVERPLTMGQRWRKWKQEAGIRRWVQLQARLCKAGKMTTTRLYRVLSERGIRVKKWSDLRTHDKERCRDLFGYLGKLWEFSGLWEKPSYWFERERDYTLGPEHYQGWLESLREYKELESMIAGVESIG